MGILVRLGLGARRGFGRIVPEPFVIAIGLTMLVVVASLVLGHWPDAVLESWNRPQGLWNLLAFAMQMCLMLVFGSALAAAPVVRRGLAYLAGVSRGPRGLVALTATVAIVLAFLNWSLGLSGGALLAREAAAPPSRRPPPRTWPTCSVPTLLHAWARSRSRSHSSARSTCG
jgi:short-chain fatty acids transporter